MSGLGLEVPVGQEKAIEASNLESEQNERESTLDPGHQQEINNSFSAENLIDLIDVRDQQSSRHAAQTPSTSTWLSWVGKSSNENARVEDLSEDLITHSVETQTLDVWDQEQPLSNQQLDEKKAELFQIEERIKTLMTEKSTAEKALESYSKEKETFVQLCADKLRREHEHWLPKIRDLQEEHARLASEDLSEFEVKNDEAKDKTKSFGQVIYGFVMSVLAHPVSQAGTMLLFTAGLLAVGVAVSAIANLTMMVAVGAMGFFGAAYVYQEASSARKAALEVKEEIKSAAPAV